MPVCHQQNHLGLNIDGHRAIPVLFKEKDFQKEQLHTVHLLLSLGTKLKRKEKKVHHYYISRGNFREKERKKGLSVFFPIGVQIIVECWYSQSQDIGVVYTRLVHLVSSLILKL